MSLALEQPQTCTSASLGLPQSKRQFWTLWPSPEKTTCSFPYRFSQGGPGSVRFGYGLGMERFERFRFSVRAVPLRRGFFCVSVQSNTEDGSGSGFGSWKTVPAVPVPRSVPGKTVPTVPVSGSGFGSWATLFSGKSTRNWGLVPGIRDPNFWPLKSGPRMYRANGRLPEVTQKRFPRPRQPLFAVPALGELESACRVSVL